MLLAARAKYELSPIMSTCTSRIESASKGGSKGGSSFRDVEPDPAGRLTLKNGAPITSLGQQRMSEAGRARAGKIIGKYQKVDHAPFVCGCGKRYKRANDGSASKPEEEHKKKCGQYQRQGIADFFKKAS